MTSVALPIASAALGSILRARDAILLRESIVSGKPRGSRHITRVLPPSSISNSSPWKYASSSPLADQQSGLSPGFPSLASSIVRLLRLGEQDTQRYGSYAFRFAGSRFAKHAQCRCIVSLCLCNMSFLHFDP